MRLNSLRLLAAIVLIAWSCTTHAFADFLSFGTPLTFTCGSNTVSSGDGLWFGSTLSCTGLSKTTKTTVSFNSSLVTYTCNGFPAIAFVPGGTITYDPKCTAPVTTYSGGTWNTTAPCSNGTTQFITGCACQLPFNAGGTISNVQWYTTSCQASANGCTATWSGVACCQSKWTASNSDCIPHSDGTCTCSAPQKWHTPCNGGSHGSGSGGTSPGATANNHTP
jgi:hypothetical protein